jgi:hypothetical protein
MKTSRIWNPVDLHVRLGPVWLALVPALLALFSPVVRAACFPVPAGASVWFPLDGTASEYFGTATGQVQAGTVFGSGWVGSGAVSFTAQGSGIQFPLPESSIHLSTFTLEGWVRRSSVLAVAWDAVGVFFSGGSGSMALGILPDGRLTLSAAGVTAVQSAGRITDEAWHHVAAVHDGASVRFYIDGIAAGTATDPGVYQHSIQYALGRFPGTVSGLTGTFFGWIDEWSVYRTALTDSAVAGIFAAGREGKCVAPLVPAFARLPRAVLTNTPFEFQLNLFNSTTNESAPVTVEIVAPAGLKLLGGRTGAGGVVLSEGRLRWTVPMVPAGTSAVMVGRGTSLGVVGEFDMEASIGGGSPLVVPGRVQVESACGGIRSAAFSWSLDGTAQESVVGLPGVLRGTTAFVEGRYEGQALEVTGLDAGLVVGNPGFASLGDFTVELWARRTSATSTAMDGNDGILMGGGDRSFALGMRSNGELFLTHVGVTAAASNTRVTDLEWHHLAVTRTGADVRFYVDGNPAGTASYPAEFANPQALGIGSLPVAVRGLFYGFVGMLDEVRFHRVVVPASVLLDRATEVTSGGCPRDLALDVTQQPRRLDPGQAGSVVVRVRNSSSVPVPEVRLLIRTNGVIGLTAIDVRDGTSTPDPTGWVVRLGELVAGEDREVTLRCLGIVDGRGDVDLEVRAEGTVLSRLLDDRRGLRIGVGDWCESPPLATVAWLRAERGLVDSAGAAAAQAEGTVDVVGGRVGKGFDTTAGTLVIADPDRFNVPEFTVQAWIFPKVLDGGVDTVFSHELNANQIATVHFALGIRGPLVPGQGTVPVGRLVFLRMGGDGLPDSIARWTDSGVSVPMQQWSHVALGSAPGVVRVWLDGVLVREIGGLPQTFVYNAGPFRVGGRTPAAGLETERFNGLIDEVVFTQRLLDRDDLAGVVLAGERGYCESDLAVGWEPVPRVVALGETFPASWVVTNLVGGTVKNVVLSQALPVGWQAEGLTASAGSIRVEAGTIRGEVEALPSMGVVRFGATLRPGVAFDGILSATVRSATPELLLSNNVAGVAVTVAPLTVGVVSVSAAEGAPGSRNNLLVPVRLSATVPRVVTVEYFTGPARPGSGQLSATVGEDFEAVSGTLTFQPGEIERTVAVPLLGDDEFEGDEAFGLILQNPTGGAVVGPLPVLIVVNDDALPVVRLGNARETEGDTSVRELVFPVTVSGSTARAIELLWSTTNVTAQAGLDFSGTSGSLVIPPRTPTAEIRIPIVADLMEEPNEAFQLGVVLADGSKGAATLADAVAVGVILNDDGGVGRVNRFEWVVPPGRKSAGVPIPVELRAVDAQGQVVSNHSGVVALGAVRLGRPTDSGRPSPLIIGEVHAADQHVSELWNVTTSPLDVSNWRVMLYDARWWPLPAVTFVFPAGTVLPAGGMVVISNGDRVGSTPWFRVPSVAWGRFSPKANAEQCVGVLIQNPVGEVVDFFGAGSADPRRIDLPVSLDPLLWRGFPLPAFKEAYPNDIDRIRQRTGLSNPRDASAWQFSRGETVNRYLQVPFVDAEVQGVEPQVALTFVDGVWRGTVTVSNPSEWMSLYADDGAGHIGVHAPVEFEVINDIRIQSYTVRDFQISSGYRFSQQVVVTNPGPAASTDVQVRVVLPQDVVGVLDESGTLWSSQGTVSLVPATSRIPRSVTAKLGTMPAGTSAVVDFTLAATTIPAEPRTLRFAAELTRAEPDHSRANNRVEAEVETGGPAAPRSPGRVAWFRGEGTVADTIGRIAATNHGVGFVDRFDRQAFRFNGTNRIELAASPDLVLQPGSTNSVLVSLWMRTPPELVQRRVIMETDGDGESPGWSLQLVDGRPAVVVGSTVHVGVTPGGDLRDGRWHLLSFEITPGATPRVDMMVNHQGVLARVANFGTSGRIGGLGRARIGGSSPADGFIGDLDEISLYRGPWRSLSPDPTLTQEFSAGSRGAVEGVVVLAVTRLGPDNLIPKVIAGRPYTLTFQVGNQGAEATLPLFAGVKVTAPIPLIGVQFGGAPVPVTETNGGFFMPLGRLPAGAQTELKLTFGPTTRPSLFPTLNVYGGPRDQVAVSRTFINVEPDADRDGIADSWERSFGLNPFQVLDGRIDSDGDGYSNLAEFNSGTRPNDAASHPRVEWVRIAEDGLRLRVATLADRDYLLESREALPFAPDAVWQPVRTYRGTGGLLEVEATSSGNAEELYFRLRAVPVW